MVDRRLLVLVLALAAVGLLAWVLVRPPDDLPGGGAVDRAGPKDEDPRQDGLRSPGASSRVSAERGATLEGRAIDAAVRAWRSDPRAGVCRSCSR